MRAFASARVAVTAVVAVTAALCFALPALAGSGHQLTIVSSGTSSMQGDSPQGTTTPGQWEWRGPKRLGKSPLRTDPLSAGPQVAGASSGASATAGKKAKSNPELLTSFEGLNHRASRLADNGNQFSGEPPDQGLCVGNGFVLETVNQAVRVYNEAGTPLTAALSLNQFYGFPPAIVRPAGPFGPFTFDISCHYDPATNRWFHLAVDLDQDPVTGDFTGKNYLDLAVSNSGDPTGTWTVYRIPAMNDGTEGTPNHNCPGGPCFGDFPHMGADANGIYITTNEFPLFADGFTGAQVYALSKAQLVSTPLSIGVTLINTADDPVRPGEPGFTVWPALSPSTQFEESNGGTEYFVSSNAVFDDANADSTELILWRLTNTSSLNAPSPAVSLTKQILNVNRYAVPSNATQKPGTIPLADCLNDDTLPVAPGLFGCWRLLTPVNPPTQVLGTLDAGDSRVLDVRYANGKVWAVLGTAAQVGGQNQTGVGWFIIKPGPPKVDKQGILALAGENLIYPTVGVTPSGRGVIGFTRVGPNLFPSVGYASLDAKIGAGDVHMIHEGQSPQDGFTEYPPIGGNRPRWGDYGAAAVDGKNVWLAGEYIEQPPCTLDQFIATAFSCFGTRTAFANWTTRVSKLQP